MTFCEVAMCFARSTTMSFAIVVINVIVTNATSGIYNVVSWTSNHVVIFSHRWHIWLHFCSRKCHVLWIEGFLILSKVRLNFLVLFSFYLIIFNEIIIKYSITLAL
jgi:hypothetical protein